MIPVWAVDGCRPRDPAMHDIIIALAFIGMIIAPAVVAAKSTEATDDSD